MDTTSASPSWVILGSVAQVSTTNSDFSYQLVAPPGVVLLTVPQRILQGITNRVTIVAANPSGLLLYAEEGSKSSIDGTDRCFYLVKPDLTSVVQLPNLENMPRPSHLGNVGFYGPAGCDHGSCVALLQSPEEGSEQATLVRYAYGFWHRKRVDYPPLSRPFVSNGVASFQDGLCWIDLSQCILFCEKYLDNIPMIKKVELPVGKELDSKKNWRSEELHKRRTVAVSNGNLQFVDICESKSASGADKVDVWALNSNFEWHLEHELSFENIWDHKSYTKTALPRKVPTLLCIDPMNNNLLYFFLDDCLFGVDLKEGEVISTSNGHTPTSSAVHPWLLPPMLCDGYLNIDDINEEFSSEDYWSDKSDEPL